MRGLVHGFRVSRYRFAMARARWVPVLFWLPSWHLASDPMIWTTELAWIMRLRAERLWADCLGLRPTCERVRKESAVNPLHWGQERWAALLVFLLLGFLIGLLAAWFDSPLYVLSSHYLSGPWADAPAVFLQWLKRPSFYWPWPLLGAIIAGLTFYAIQLWKPPTSTRADS